MNKQRIQVYADVETKRRIELAAAKHETSVTEYCLTAIERQLADDDVLEAEHVHISVKPSNVVTELRQLRSKILAEREGAPINLDALFEELHEERDHELLGMR